MARHTFYNNMPQGATISYHVWNQRGGWKANSKKKNIITIGQLLKLALDLNTYLNATNQQTTQDEGNDA